LDKEHVNYQMTWHLNLVPHDSHIQRQVYLMATTVSHGHFNQLRRKRSEETSSVRTVTNAKVYSPRLTLWSSFCHRNVLFFDTNGTSSCLWPKKLAFCSHSCSFLLEALSRMTIIFLLLEAVFKKSKVEPQGL
jgi:hypothetical protein